MNKTNTTFLNSLRTAKEIYVNGDLVIYEISVEYKSIGGANVSCLSNLSPVVKTKDIISVHTVINNHYWELWDSYNLKIIKKENLFFCIDHARKRSFILRSYDQPKRITKAN